MSITCFGQDSLNVDSKQVNEGDSIHAASTTTTMFSNNTLDNVTKTEGDSAYIKEDYTAAIQIYEALLKNGEAAEVYYNLKLFLITNVPYYYNPAIVIFVLTLK